MRQTSPVCCWNALFLAVYCCASMSGGVVAADPKPPTSTDKPSVEQFTPVGKEAVASMLERLRQTGCFNHPDYPWVLRARHVRGDTLYFVELLQRREDGKGFDRVGKAVKLKLRYSDNYYPDHEPGDKPLPPVRRDTLLVNLIHVKMQWDDGSTAFFPERAVKVPFPSRLRESGFRPYSEAEVLLSQKQREELNKEYELDPKQKLLIKAFGDEGADFFGVKNIGESETGQTLVAATEEVENLDAGRRARFESIAVIRCNKAGEILLSFRGKDITVDGAEFYKVMLGDESQNVTFQGANGLKFFLPGIKAAP